MVVTFAPVIELTSVVEVRYRPIVIVYLYYYGHALSLDHGDSINVVLEYGYLKHHHVVFNGCNAHYSVVFVAVGGDFVGFEVKGNVEATPLERTTREYHSVRTDTTFIGVNG
jgi:hypothetical protein